MRVIIKKDNKGFIRSGGFTLVETILASVILCASILALGAISTRSLSGTKLNRQYETAVGWAERQLVMIDYIGVEDFIESGRTEGDFDNYEPVYHWQVSTQSIGIDNLYQVKVVVSWIGGTRQYNVTADTRLNGTGRLIEVSAQ